MKLKQIAFLGFFITLFLFLSSQDVNSKNGLVHVLKVEGVIDPVTVEYIVKGINRAANQGATCLVIEMDTPGGLSTSMQKICQAILNSPVPIIVYVSPSGAQAASAGVFITLSAHIAIMAPGTNIGAAHPVDMSGNKASDKITENAAAYARTIALQRGRNAEWAEEAVRKSVSLTDVDAVKQNVVDFTAKDIDEILQKINGRKIILPHTEVILNTEDPAIENISMNWRDNFLHTLSNPNIAFVLMLIGIYGLIYELASPGFGLSGIAGGICILLALVAFEALPFSLAGLLLILFSVGLFIAEIKAPTFGVLTAGGIITFIFGAMFIFSPINSPHAPYISVHVSWSTIITMALITTGFFVFVVTKGLQAMKRPAALGRHLLQNAIGIAKSDLSPDGIVYVQGEEWKAVTEGQSPIKTGDKIKVIRIDGLTLIVEKVLNQESQGIM